MSDEPNYITPAGFARMMSEVEFLTRRERPRVVQEVQDAAAQGDRSENAEYIYGKKRLREIDSRVRFLRKRLDGMVVVDQPPTDRDRVFFGAWVTLEDDTAVQSRRRIVGPDEFDMDPRYVSMDAPLARALLGKRLDDEVTVETPGGGRTFAVTAIDY